MQSALVEKYTKNSFRHGCKGSLCAPKNMNFCQGNMHFTLVLNMIRFPDHDPTGFCNSEPDPEWTGLWTNLYRIGYGCPNCVDHCSQMLNQSFSDINPIGSNGIGNGLLFHMTQPISRSTIKAIACSKPTISACSKPTISACSKPTKYLDSVMGLGSDWITHWKYWTGLGSQKSSIRSTLLHTIQWTKLLAMILVGVTVRMLSKSRNYNIISGCR